MMNKMAVEILTKKTETEFIEEDNSQAKTFKGWLQGYINKSRKTELSNIELPYVLQQILDKYKEYEKKNVMSSVKLDNWKGQDRIRFIEKPDYFEVYTHQKKDQDSLPKETKREITKLEINQVIAAINTSKGTIDKKTKETYYKTKEIAKNYSIIANIKQTKSGENLFPNNKFVWSRFFGNRHLHTNLNLCLRLLDYYKVIRYRAGRSVILNKNFEFQKTLE